MVLKGEQNDKPDFKYKKVKQPSVRNQFLK